MAQHPILCSLNLLRPCTAGPSRLALQAAQGVVDDGDWGVLPMTEIQQRLVEADDFAVLMLSTSFTTADPLEDLLIEVNAAGLRNLTVDADYLVPLKSADEQIAQYRMPSPLPAGEHRLAWSYAWTPPCDRSSGEPLHGGVTLRPPILCGAFIVVEGRAARWPATLNGRELSAEVVPAEGVAVELDLDLPVWPAAVHLEGPRGDQVQLTLGGEELHTSADLPLHAPVPPQLSGRQVLRIAFTGAPQPLTLLRLDPA